MADPEQVKVLRQGAEAWKAWRSQSDNAADLRKADLRKADLREADLRIANLSTAELAQAVLVATDLRWAALRQTKLNKANLDNANLRGADLTNANLEGATGLLAEQLAGSRVTGATLSTDIAQGFTETLGTIEEAAKNARKLLFGLLLACMYCWLTIATTTDARLLTNTASSPLPIVGTEIPIAGFYWAAPAILLSVYLYLHLMLQHLWKLLATLPAVFPDGVPLDEKAYPWLLTGLVRMHTSLGATRELLSHRRRGTERLCYWRRPAIYGSSEC